MRVPRAVLVAAVILYPLAAFATIINVPDDYATIQEGINHGSHGDTVLVQPDTYDENLLFNGHKVVLASLFLTTGDTSYISSTIIDGGRRNSVIKLEDAEDSTARIVGLTITNGGGAYVDGGGIHCSGAHPIIDYNIITRDSAAYGGAIYCYYASPRISHNTITDNKARSIGSAVYCHLSSHPMINNNIITDNHGTAILVYNNSDPTIIDNEISGTVGSGISGQESDAIVRGNTITGNSASQGGGIDWTWHGAPIISNNTISGNSAGLGGGIYCGSNCEAVIDSNTITDNSATSKGGGIYCYGCNPTISNNTISGNWVSADYCDGGGGVFCNNRANPTISDNLIVGNWVSSNYGARGGAIHCYDRCNPEITNTLFKQNSANGHGGAINLEYSSNPTITRCSFDRNSAGANGGGIRCKYGAAPTVTNCTFSANSADTSGGGIDCDWLFTSPMTNCILWGNTALNGPQIYVPEGAPDPTLTYCDIEGGWTGQGNIDSDPLLVCPERGDLNLRWRSPCMDTGDPGFPLDPDSTRADIGTHYFDQNVMALVELYPHNTPIVLPPEGGKLLYDGWIFNFYGRPGRTDVWTYAFVPGVGRYGPLTQFQNFRVPADSVGSNNFSEKVPGIAPAGEYTFVAYIGSYPFSIIDSSYFCFSKSGVSRGGIESWSDGGGWLRLDDSEETGLPTRFALLQNYPNPFNARTRINYQLPRATEVRLEVYNLSGQKVTTLVDSKQQSGYRSVVWDASEASSGLYFYKLTTGDYTETKRMMLVK